MTNPKKRNKKQNLNKKQINCKIIMEIKDIKKQHSKQKRTGTKTNTKKTPKK